MRWSIKQSLRLIVCSLHLSICATLLTAAGDPRSLCALGDQAMLEGDWYLASEHYAEALRLNASYLDARSGLARASYELGEYDQALVHVQQARRLSPRNSTLGSLEAFILIALGQTARARSLVEELLLQEPYNRDAMFARAELDIVEGRPASASLVYRQALERYPDDKRALVSLALLSLSLDDRDHAWRSIQRALSAHPDDPRVYYYAAWMDSQEGRFDRAKRRLENCLAIEPGFHGALQLLSIVQYKSGEYSSSIASAENLIRYRRHDTAAWYIKARSQSQLGQYRQAMQTLKTALAIDPEDEFMRMALSDLIISQTKLEDSEREGFASWHFERAERYRRQNLRDQALYEYQRALRLAPYSPRRARYADLLGSMGFPARQLEELSFMQDIGISNTAINDAVEAWNSLLVDSLHRRWEVDPLSIPTDSWKLAIFVLDTVYSSIHVDAPFLSAELLKDVLRQSDGVSIHDLATVQASFSTAWRSAREAGTDYFMIVSASEADLDFSMQVSVHSSRTGSLLENIRVFHTGMDKVRNATRKTQERILQILPFRSRVVARQGNRVLIGAGRLRGLEKDMTLKAVTSGKIETDIERMTIKFDRQHHIADLLIEEVDEYVALARVSRVGFFDRLVIRDHVLHSVEDEGESRIDSSNSIPVVPAELRSLIRSVR